MSQWFFEKLPTTTYNNLQTRDLTRRIKLDETLRQQTQLFYPISINDQLRPDQIAEAYYRDPSVDWFVFITNEIVDPYYAWPMDQLEFDQYIENRYTDVETAKQRVKYYRLNWPSDDKEIVAAYYDSLPDALKKYYTPVFNARGVINTYRRKQDDFVCATNKIVNFDIELANNDIALTAGEFVDIKHSGLTIGTAEVVFCNTTTAIINHVVGNSAANSSYTVTLIGESSAANATSNNSVVAYQTLSDDEASYWSQVSYWDWENEKNERNKHLILLEPSVVPDVIETIRTKLAKQ